MVGHLILAMMVITPTDQTVQVAKGTKLDIKQAEQTLTIRGRSLRGGRPRSLDYTLSVPSWMAITVGGMYADVTMEGVGGDVSVETTHGDINVRGGSGFVSLKSVQGEITLEKAKGRIEVRAINEGIRLADISGDLSAESTNGSIILDRIDSGNVDLYTVNGNISYDGPIKDKGLYRLTTHNGLIAMPIPEKVNAMLTVRTYNGGFRSTFPLGSDTAERRNKRFTLTLGNGSAHVELESFGGTISLRRPGEPRPETERRRMRERGKDQAAGPYLGGDHLFDQDVELAVQATMLEAQPVIDGAVVEAMREAGPEIERAMNEAMAALHEIAVPHIMPMPVPMPNPLPMPRPLPRR
ncbi:MAG: hypothetical protein DMF96_09720 [Acidobacteria bacterium]|nr:MAG: hypothetical protein DMF96_09720 [Acidobacteriota bacterium]